jgi:hypothetical protein
MTRIRQFYHLGADTLWKPAARQHIAACHEAALPGAVTVGVTGTPGRSALARDWLAEQWPLARVKLLDGEFEQPTLRLARDWALVNPDGMVLYAHAKGSANLSPVQEAWRESMTIDVITRWRECIAQLSAGYDVAGAHWLDPVVYPNMLIATQANGGSQTPFFGGNFWWATAAYLISLPVPSALTRWGAERWIGLGHPKAADMRPGWPTIMLFAGPAAERMLQRDFWWSG